MASLEMQLLSRIIRKGQLHEALDWGILQEDFLTDEGRQYIKHLITCTQDVNMGTGGVGPYALHKIYPTFEVCDDDQTALEVLCHEVRKNRLRIDLKAAIQYMVDRMDFDPLEAAANGERMLKSILALGYSKKTDVSFVDSLNRTIGRMEQMERGVDLSVIHWPWPSLNEATLGIEDSDYIVYYGRPKSKKSWVLAEHIAFTYNEGKKPLIYTKEMHPDNIFMRVAACIARLPYHEFRSAKLIGDERDRLYYLQKMIQEMRASSDMVCLSGRDAPGGSDTVEWLQAKIEKHKPHAVFIDGMYLMSDSKGSSKQKDNERVMNVSRGLRQMVLSTKIPVICTLQANRKAAAHNEANLDELAFSDSVSQDATGIIRVINEKTTPTIAMVMGGAREYQLHGIRIGGVPATDFSEKEVMTEKEITNAKPKDTGDEPEKAAAHTKAKDTKKEEKEKLELAERKMIRNKVNGIKAIM